MLDLVNLEHDGQRYEVRAESLGGVAVGGYDRPSAPAWRLYHEGEPDDYLAVLGDADGREKPEDVERMAREWLATQAHNEGDGA